MMAKKAIVKKVLAVVRFAGLLLMMTTAVSAQAPERKPGPGAMSLEEKLVRLAYMKLEFYNRATNIERDRKRGNTHRNSDDLIFRVNVLKKGALEEILDTPFSQLVTKPVGEILSIGQITSSEVTNGGSRADTFGYSASWSGGANPVEDWSLPFREALRLLGGVASNRYTYITYEVEASLEGKSRRYLSLALFAPGFEGGDPSTIFFFDLIVGLKDRVGHLLYQSGTPVGGNHSPKATVRKSITGLDSGSTSASPDASPIVCSFETFKCCWGPGFRHSGLNYPACENPPSRGNEDGGLNDNQDSFALTYINSETSCEPGSPGCRFSRYQRSRETSGSDNSSHFWGEHGTRVRSTGFCQITANCEAECGHDDPDITWWDSGMPTLSCHVFSKEVSSEPRHGTYNQAIPFKCSQKSSVTWSACTLCACGTPPFNIPWETRQLWTFAHNDEYTCGEQ